MHGLEAALVAVELVLESGVPSAEHVSNVLARLKQTDMAASVETTLKINAISVLSAIKPKPPDSLCSVICRGSISVNPKSINN